MATEAEKKEQALSEYRSKLQKHKEIDTKVRALRETVKELKKDYDKTEDDLKALQVGWVGLSERHPQPASATASMPSNSKHLRQ